MMRRCMCKKIDLLSTNEGRAHIWHRTDHRGPSIDGRNVVRLETQATFALNGNGGCDLENMKRSCFAIEGCASGRHPVKALTLRGLLEDASHAFVAVARTEQGLEFVGCVGFSNVNVGQQLFKFPPVQHPGLYLFRLCVAEEFRRHGVAAMLLNSARNIAHCHIYLVVVSKSESDVVRPYLKERADRLRRLYQTKMGFQLLCEEDMGCLLIKPPS